MRRLASAHRPGQESHRNPPRKSNGFTLLELMVTVAIIGALAGIAIPAFSSYLGKAKIIKAIAEIETLEKEILAFDGGGGGLPNTLGDIGRAGLLDPWGNPYQYLNFATVSGLGPVRKDRSLVPLNSDFDLYSMGPDGKSKPPLTAKDSHDDIIRANDGAYIGTAAEY